MSRQATLFGKAVKKQPFFETAGDSDYYRTINCLWQLSKTTNKDGPALIEFVPYVLRCVSINNILLRTGGVGGWVRKNLKLLRIGKNFR